MPSRRRMAKTASDMRGPAGAALTRLFLSVFQYFLVYCIGTVKGFTIVVPQTAITGYEDLPLLLQASCHQCQTDTFLQITWEMVNSVTGIAMYTVRHTSPLNEKLSTSDQYQNRITVFLNGSLLIHQLNLSDQGMYEVTMKNSKTSKSARINVTVLRAVMGLKFVVPQTSVAGYEGHPLLLQAPCHLFQAKTFLQITWTLMNSSERIMYTFRNSSTKLSMSDHYRDRATVFANGSLLIHTLRLSDQGAHEVTILDPENSADAVVHVTVLRNHEAYGMEHCNCTGNRSTDGFPVTPVVYLAMRAISVVLSALFILGVHLLLKNLNNKKGPRQRRTEPTY